MRQKKCRHCNEPTKLIGTPANRWLPSEEIRVHSKTLSKWCDPDLPGTEEFAEVAPRRNRPGWWRTVGTSFYLWLGTSLGVEAIIDVNDVPSNGLMLPWWLSGPLAVTTLWWAIERIAHDVIRDREDTVDRLVALGMDRDMARTVMRRKKDGRG